MQELTLKELQQVSLQILVDVHTFCIDNDIKYSLAYGTLIGAVRHKGFIPWDDDIDIMMPRPDFEQFCQSYSSEKYKLIYNGNDNTSLIGFARIVDCRETTFRTNKPWTKQDSGVWIDVFPIDGIENDLKEYSKRYKELRRLCKFAYKFRWENHKIVHNDRFKYVFKKNLYQFISLRRKTPSIMFKKMIDLMKKIDYSKSQYVGQCAYQDDGPIRFPKKEFESYIDIDFENYKFKSISEYDNHLRRIYGDYMQLPPIEAQKAKQHYIRFYWKKETKI